MPRRRGNNPKRRIMPRHEADESFLTRILGTACYTGNSHHKRFAADYGFHPLVNPRPNKSLCDGSGRTVKLSEAQALFREGVRLGMVSGACEDGLSKYVWAVDADGRAYEAKISRGSRNYHGYELGKDDAMRRLVYDEWRVRCPAD